MDVTENKKVTYNITNVTEYQARALTRLAVRLCDDERTYHLDDDEIESINHLRQAFVSAGVKPRGR